MLPAARFSTLISLPAKYRLIHGVRNSYFQGNDLARRLPGLPRRDHPGPGGSPAAETEFAAYAKRNFQEAQAHYRKAPGEATAAWQFGRACFDLAEFATNNTERASLAEQGIAACRLALARESNSAPAHYYLGMNLAQLARTKGLSALKLVDQMEREFTRARDLDEQLDYAGPDRNLGLLYRDAPVIGSIGSRTRAREHLRRAVEVAPAVSREPA